MVILAFNNIDHGYNGLYSTNSHVKQHPRRQRGHDYNHYLPPYGASENAPPPPYGCRIYTTEVAYSPESNVSYAPFTEYYPLSRLASHSHREALPNEIERRCKRNEKQGGVRASVNAAFQPGEKRKVGPGHTLRHRIEEAVARAGAASMARYAPGKKY